MGHLGQGTQITTVEDKEIVLTASNGQHFRMKVADLAEAVRQVMPVATSEQNGLMSRLNAVKSYNLKPGDELEVLSSNYCLLLIKNVSSGRTSLLLIGHYNVDVVYTSGDIGTDNSGIKTIVYKKEAGGNCFIKNNGSSEQSGRIFVM